MVYVDDVVEVDSDPEESSIREWTTDSGMPRGPDSGSQRSSGSQGSGRSLTAVSLAASVRSVDIAQLFRKKILRGSSGWLS